MSQTYMRLIAIAAMGAILTGCATQPEQTTEPEVIEIDTSTEGAAADDPVARTKRRARMRTPPASTSRGPVNLAGAWMT